MATNVAYDLSLFETVMPQPRPVVQQPTVIRRKPKSKAQLRREAIASALQATKVLAVTLALCTLFGLVIASRVKLILAQREGQNIRAQLTEVQDENARLDMALDTMVSGENVEDYAVNVLGMKKLERYQIHYLESGDSDRAVVHDGLN